MARCRGGLGRTPAAAVTVSGIGLSLTGIAGELRLKGWGSLERFVGAGLEPPGMRGRMAMLGSRRDAESGTPLRE